MPTARKTGPLTFDELLELWKSGTDPAYSDALLATEDGLAIVGQLLTQMVVTSEAIDETFQTLFVTPGSGQTGEPASGPRWSRVTLTISRVSELHVPIVFLPGALRAEEVADDMSPDGPVPARPGRSYASTELGVLLPGRTEIPLLMGAERAGRGHDLPRPGTIRGFVQPGAGLANDRATAVRAEPLHRLIVPPRPDAPVPEVIGSYLMFLGGANVGRIARVAGYEAPADDGSTGGTLLLAATGSYALALIAGDFEPGESIVQLPSGAQGVFLAADGERFLLDRSSGTFELLQVVVGSKSGAQAAFSALEIDPEIVDEGGTAAWKILSWDRDLGLSCANAESPTGGRAAMLDEIGHERGLLRDADEDDETFRHRLASIADTITPSAIRRTVNRVLAPAGREGRVREVGRPEFRGLFYDAPPTDDPGVAFAFDHEGCFFDLHTPLSYEEFRGFFLVEIPESGEGDYGVAYDAGVMNAYDNSPYLASYDGIAIGAAIEARSVWRAVDKARAFGVGFELVLPCRPA